MFDSELRDGLLFEDENFSYSRRYFWAYNTLGVINVGIDSMVSAYRETFTDEFWKGKHKKLWPHPDPESSDGEAYAKCMGVLKLELDREVNNLEKVREKNTKTQGEIALLRDQLFSGSSVKESRRAIEQGDNIKILTVVSMLFLPLTFVTVSQLSPSFSFLTLYFSVFPHQLPNVHHPQSCFIYHRPPTPFPVRPLFPGLTIHVGFTLHTYEKNISNAVSVRFWYHHS